MLEEQMVRVLLVHHSEFCHAGDSGCFVLSSLINCKVFYDFTIKYSWKYKSLLKLISQRELLELFWSLLLIGNIEGSYAKKSFTRFLLISPDEYIVSTSKINFDNPTGSYLPSKSADSWWTSILLLNMKKFGLLDYGKF